MYTSLNVFTFNNSQGSVASLYFINCGGSDRVTQAGVAGIQCQHIDTSCSRPPVSIDAAVAAYLSQNNAGVPPIPDPVKLMHSNVISKD